VALEEAKFIEEIKNTMFVDTFKKGIAALKKDVGIPTISPTRTSKSCQTLFNQFALFKWLLLC
jgi:hypothetical protein